VTPPRLFITIVATVAAWGQGAAFHEGELHGRRAFILENGRMRMATLPGGGFIGEIRLVSDDPKKSVNPMRVPHYPTIDPYAYDVAKHGALYGTDIQRRLMSGYMGDFLCFPHFGPSSAAEFALDLGQHGEALAVEWKRESVDTRPDAVTLAYAADLPKTQYRVSRRITLPAGETVAYVEETVENLAQFDRSYQSVRHVTFGPPFLELNKTFVDAPVAKSAVRAGQVYEEGGWPVAQSRDLRAFTGQTGMWLLDRTQPKVWFTIYSTEYSVLLGYILPAGPHPWVLDWQENQRAKQKPWDGKVVARAVCIGDSPFAQGLAQAVRTGSLFGAPAYSWMGAREKKTQNYVIFLAEIPQGFRGVADVRTGVGEIQVQERETGRVIRVKGGRAGL
jgi:hypothetical protein